MRHLDIRDITELDTWLRASPDLADKALSVFLRPRIKVAQGDLTALMVGLAHELAVGVGAGDDTDSPLVADAGDTASSLILAVLRVHCLRAVAVRAPGVLDALVAALDSPLGMVRDRALACLASTCATVDEDLVARGLLPRLLTILASNDLWAATEADTILSVIVGAGARHHDAFIEAGGPDIVRRLLREGRPWVADGWLGLLRGLHGARTTFTATYSLDEHGWWFVDIPGLPGCHTN